MSQPTPAPNPDVIRNRLPYSPIADRPKLRLPGGARVAVWTIVNVEVWDTAHPMPRTVVPPPMGQPLLPDVPNWAWHEYGMRVGFGRFLEVLGARELRRVSPSMARPAKSIREACKAAHEAGWDFIGHGFMQRPMHRVDDQPGAIRQTIEAITALTGKPPRGWESPGLTETKETLDHLAAAGIEYVCDWCLDDQPVLLRSAPKPIVAMPYTLEINDVVISAVQGHRSDEIYLRGIRPVRPPLPGRGAFSRESWRSRSIPISPGVPHRIKYLEALYDHILRP